MEDDHSIGLEGRKAFVGVFDGHNGDRCARWTAANMARSLARVGEFSDDEIKSACLRLDRDYLRTFGQGGSTATFVLLDTDAADGDIDIIIGNIGDSRVIMSRGSEAVSLTKDHRVDNETELQRIISAGGFIANGRVDGILAPTRALGDGMFKGNAELQQTEQKVSAEPEIFRSRLAHGDFIFLGCDGIFESFSNEDVVMFVRDALETDLAADPALVVASLLDEALCRGSRDNMTAILLLPQEGRSYNQEEREYLPGTYSGDSNEACSQKQDFLNAYQQHATHHGFTVPQSLELAKKNRLKGYYPRICFAH